MGNKIPIGKTYYSRYGNKLTVVGREVRHRDDKLILVCDICSVDTELWPDGSISCVPSTLNTGGSPCGCSKSVKWSEDQIKVRVKRMCKKLGYKVYSWWDTYENISDTKVYLYNSLSDIPWSVSITDFLDRGSQDPSLRYERIADKTKTPLQEVMQRIRKYCKEAGTTFKGFPDGYINSKSRITFVCQKGHVRNTKVDCFDKSVCKTCKTDKTLDTKAKGKKVIAEEKIKGELDGLFLGWVDNNKRFKTTDHFRWRCKKNHYCETSYAAFKQKGVGCRKCNNGRVMITEQNLLQKLLPLIESEGGKFLCWEGTYTGMTSKFRWLCKNGHQTTPYVNHYIHKGTRCCKCARGNYGYYSSREQEKDYLYVIQFNSDYIKVGRSFEPSRRVGELIDDSGIVDLKALHLYTGTHEKVFEFEQYCHDKLEIEGYYHSESEWTIETFHKESYDSILNLVGLSVLEEVPVTDLQNTINNLKETK